MVFGLMARVHLEQNSVLNLILSLPKDSKSPTHWVCNTSACLPIV